MVKIVTVIYKNGQLYPVEPLDLPENQIIMATFEFPLPKDTRNVEEKLAAFDAVTEHSRSLDLPRLPEEAFERENYYPKEDGPNTNYEPRLETAERSDNDCTA